VDTLVIPASKSASNPDTAMDSGKLCGRVDIDFSGREKRRSAAADLVAGEGIFASIEVETRAHLPQR